MDGSLFSNLSSGTVELFAAGVVKRIQVPFALMLIS